MTQFSSHSKAALKYSLVLVFICLPLILCSPAQEECNNINVINSRISACEKLPSGSETCAISGQAQVTLPTIGSSTCLFFSDESSHNVYFVRIVFTNLLYQWTTIHQYYTYPVSVHISSALTLARKQCFATFAGVGGGGLVRPPPPWRFQTKRRRASRKRPADCARRVLAIGGMIFGPRSILDPVMAGQRSNFREFRDFLVSRVHISKTIDHSGMKPSPACSPFNSA